MTLLNGNFFQHLKRTKNNLNILAFLTVLESVYVISNYMYLVIENAIPCLELNFNKDSSVSGEHQQYYYSPSTGLVNREEIVQSKKLHVRSIGNERESRTHSLCFKYN